MEELEMEVPKLDEQYEMEESTSTSSKKFETSFFFKEIDGFSNNGEPVLEVIVVTENSVFGLPFKLSAGMTYLECCSILGKKADYYDDFIDNSYFWVLENKLNKKNIFLNLSFYSKDEQLVLENGFAISNFTEEGLEERDILPNEK